MATGIASAFIAAFIGLVQDNPKTVLAHSSVSQMGLVSIGLGAALMVPAAWPKISAAILLFAVHHAVAKMRQQFARPVAPTTRQVLNGIQHKLESDLVAGLLIGLPAVVMFALMIV